MRERERRGENFDAVVVADAAAVMSHENINIFGAGRCRYCMDE